MHVGDPNNEHLDNGTIQLKNYWKFVIQAMAWIENKKFVNQAITLWPEKITLFIIQDTAWKASF